MDEETQRAFDAGRPSAVSLFLLLLMLAATLAAGATYFGIELFGSGKPQPTFNDVLCVASFFVAGTCVTVSLFCQWRRVRAAPNRKYLREHPASALEQWAQIAGAVLLCVAFLTPSRLISVENKAGTVNLMMALVTGLHAVACIFGFFHERATRPPKSAV